MHTLFDFVSDVYAVQYGLALLFMLGFIIFCEILMPRPFQGLLKSAVDDVRFFKTQEKKKLLQLLKNIALGPVYLVFYLTVVPVLFYLAAVPLLFVRGMASPLGKLLSPGTSFAWSPVRAYLTGRKKARKAKKDDSGQQNLD